MKQFRITPAQEGLKPLDITGQDGAYILQTIARMNCKAAAVEQDGVYAFSARLDTSGVWTIYRAPDQRADEPKTGPLLARAHLSDSAGY